MAEQIPLGLRLPESATFANFYPGENNPVLMHLQNLSNDQSTEHFIYLWGKSGAGRTHLLQACCQNNLSKSAIYLNLDESELTPDILSEIEQLDLVCMDNIDTVFGNRDWELALFNFYLRAQDRQSHLIIAGLMPPARSACELADLRSRLTSGLILQIHLLNDEQKIIALQNRAHSKGLFLSAESAQFLINHYPRNTQILFSALDILDQASFISKHRLTIPFIKQTLTL